MATGKRYYWLKLHDDFFDSKRIKKLRRMAGGDTYLIIYLKMQLLAMKSDGVLKWTGLEENFADELALDLDESPDNVQVVLAYLLNCGLAETSDNISYFLPYAISNTGSETASTQRVKEHRKRLKALQCNTDETQVKQLGNAEIEKEIDIEIEKRKKDIKKEKARHKYGTYKNVLLSDEDMDKLKAEFSSDYEERIERVSEYCEQTGKTYKNYLATIRAWSRKEVNANVATAKPIAGNAGGSTAEPRKLNLQSVCLE